MGTPIISWGRDCHPQVRLTLTSQKLGILELNRPDGQILCLKFLLPIGNYLTVFQSILILTSVLKKTFQHLKNKSMSLSLAYTSSVREWLFSSLYNMLSASKPRKHPESLKNPSLYKKPKRTSFKAKSVACSLIHISYLGLIHLLVQIFNPQSPLSFRERWEKVVKVGIIWLNTKSS